MVYSTIILNRYIACGGLCQISTNLKFIPWWFGHASAVVVISMTQRGRCHSKTLTLFHHELDPTGYQTDRNFPVVNIRRQTI